MRALPRLSVERGNLASQARQDLGASYAALHVILKRSVARQPLHLYRPLEDFAWAFDRDARAMAHHGNHAQVDAQRQASVQADFFVAKVTALVQGREIEIAKVHGLLDLVDEPAGQEHDRNVRLANFDRVDGKRICLWVGERFDQNCQFHDDVSRAIDWCRGDFDR